MYFLEIHTNLGWYFYVAIVFATFPDFIIMLISLKLARHKTKLIWAIRHFCTDLLYCDLKQKESDQTFTEHWSVT